MKLLLPIFLLATSLLANEQFEKGSEYICFNTHTMQQGQKYTVKKEDSADKPFIFTIKDNQLITSDNISFDFRMEKGDMASYSNEGYMLLLLKNKELGLVPKKARGQVQYYFQCKLK